MGHLDFACFDVALASLVAGIAGWLSLRRQCRNLPLPEPRLDSSPR
jgi:hypothetical protein